MISLPSALPPQTLQPDESARARQLQAQLTAGGRAAHGKSQDVKTTATELASLFVAQMLQAMRRTIPKSGLLDQGFAHDTYVSLFDQEIARHVAQREDLGLTAILQRQLTKSDTDHQLPGRPTTPLPRPPAALSPHPTLHPSPFTLHPSPFTLHPSPFTLHPSPSSALKAYRQQATPTDSMFITPVAGQHTSSFGWRVHPIDHDERWHDGMDIAAPAGTPVRAAAAGQVVVSGTQPGYGNVVIIQHPEGYATLYAHNTENLVPVGTSVSQGQSIATVGSTGRATGPHVHFEVRKDGQRLDPAPFLEASNAKKNNV